MNYLFYAIAAQLFWAVGIIFDKILRTNYIKNSITLVIFFGINNFLLMLPILLFTKIVIPETKILLAALFAGILMTLAFLPYIISLSFEEASRIAPLWHISPIFVLLLAFLFLGEKLSLNNYIGFFFLLLGGFLISTRKIKDILKVSKAFWLMLLAGFLFSISEILTKSTYNKLDFWNGFFWILSGFLIGSLILLLKKKYRDNFKKSVLNLSRVSFSFLIVGALTGIVGRILFFLAISLGSISLAAIMGGFEGLFVLIYAIILSKYLPKLFKEEIDKKIIAHKITAIFLMFIGLVFIYI